MILCVTLNPVLDTTFFVDEMRPVYRTEAQRVTYVAGGKGDNVARALGVLGEPAHALVALGGDTGRHVANLLAAEGLAATPAWMSGETRLQITVVDRAREQRAFYAPAVPFTADDRAEFRLRFEDLLPGVDAVCISGSAPDAKAAELVPELLTLARDRGLPTLLDSSGEGLRQGVTAAPHIIKVNLAEAEALLGRGLVKLSRSDGCTRRAAWVGISLGHPDAGRAGRAVRCGRAALVRAASQGRSDQPDRLRRRDDGRADGRRRARAFDWGVLPAGHGCGRSEHADVGCVPVRCSLSSRPCCRRSRWMSKTPASASQGTHVGCTVSFCRDIAAGLVKIHM